ncbi:beta-carotene 15,15'-monooxygenase [Sphingobacteriaceae bacterium WQ 2009]|uniref:Beta-carotene 15,15'-monooxygenase n=1 Tax=Rhinopithecimicrobium faecis TaxID=2820698 RepID=A0A8T4HGP3_9SPHI|nr:beta-carotene 15,15'-monooxygenase [Sphingobacteriaceae bacterium WQ 2009]
MIQFLKESTFAVNEVFVKSVELLKRNYFSVAGLCFLLFITSNASSALAVYFKDINVVLSIFMALIFVVLYFGINLSLFKYILSQIDREDHFSVSATIPSTKELLNFFTAMISIAGISIVMLLLFAVVCFPIVYLKVPVSSLANIVLIGAAVFTFIFVIRVAFYPFFIIDRKETSIRAIRLSFALTKGNVTKLLLILAIFALLHLLQWYFNFMGYNILAVCLSFVNSFLVVPLSSIVITVAYRDMISDYQGGDDPAIIKNII